MRMRRLRAKRGGAKEGGLHCSVFLEKNSCRWHTQKTKDAGKLPLEHGRKK